MATAAVLDTLLRAKTDSFNKPIRKSQSVFSQFTKSLKQASTVAVTGVVAIGGAATALMVKFASAGDEINKMSSRLQVSTKDFQSLRYAMEQSGGTGQQLESAFKTMNKSILDMQQGTGEAQRDFGLLQVSLADLDGKTQADRFRIMAKGLDNIKDASTKAAVAQRLFGKGSGVIRTMGSDVESLESRFESLNLGMSKESTDAAAELTDTFNEMRLAFMKGVSEVGTAMMPVFKRMAEMMVYAASKISFLTEKWDALQRKIIKWRFGTDIQLATPEAQRLSAQFESAQEQFKFEDQAAAADAAGMKARQAAAAKQLEIKGIDQQIDNQKMMIDSIKEQTKAIAPLPSVLLKGTSETAGFINNLNRKNADQEIKDLNKKQVEEAEKRLKELQEIRKALEADKTETVEIL